MRDLLVDLASDNEVKNLPFARRQRGAMVPYWYLAKHAFHPLREAAVAALGHTY
jgi:hypothetical protein